MSKPKKFTHYAHTANHWALGVSLNHAKQRIRDSASSTTHEYGYQVCEFSRPIPTDEIEVHPINGSVSLRDGVSISIVYTSPKARKYFRPDGIVKDEYSTH